MYPKIRVRSEGDDDCCGKKEESLKRLVEEVEDDDDDLVNLSEASEHSPNGNDHQSDLATSHSRVSPYPTLIVSNKASEQTFYRGSNNDNEEIQNESNLKNHQGSKEESRPFIRARLVPRPRAVLSSPVNDGKVLRDNQSAETKERAVNKLKIDQAFNQNIANILPGGMKVVVFEKVNKPERVDHNSATSQTAKTIQRTVKQFTDGNQGCTPEVILKKEKPPKDNLNKDDSVDRSDYAATRLSRAKQANLNKHDNTKDGEQSDRTTTLRRTKDSVSKIKSGRGAELSSMKAGSIPSPRPKTTGSVAARGTGYTGEKSLPATKKQNSPRGVWR